MPKKMSCIKTRIYKLTKGIGGNTHKGHRDPKKCFNSMEDVKCYNQTLIDMKENIEKMLKCL
jgi:hypothetical protein